MHILMMGYDCDCYRRTAAFLFVVMCGKNARGKTKLRDKVLGVFCFIHLTDVLPCCPVQLNRQHSVTLFIPVRQTDDSFILAWIYKSQYCLIVK